MTFVVAGEFLLVHVQTIDNGLIQKNGFYFATKTKYFHMLSYLDI